MASERGNPDQTTTLRLAKRFIFITTNNIIRPSTDAAQHRRYIAELFTEEHQKRKNRKAYMDFMANIQPGFMYGIFNELFSGVSINDVVNEIQMIETANDLVKLMLDKINALCRKYGIPQFPGYDTYEKDELNVDDEFTALIEYAIAEHSKIQNSDDYGHRQYSDLTLNDVDVEEIAETTVVWLTGSAYRKIQRRLALKHMTITELFADYVKNSHYGIHATNKFHRFNGYPGRGFAVWIKETDGKQRVL